MPLISRKVSLELKWNKNCVITSLKERQVDACSPIVREGAATGASLAINDCKLYIPVVTFFLHATVECGRVFGSKTDVRKR